MKKLSNLELKLKKVAVASKSYADGLISANALKRYVKATANTGYLKTYILSTADSLQAAEADANRIEIDIPKDFLVKSGSIQTVSTADSPYTGAVVGDKYLELTINVQEGTASDSKVYIPVKDLVDVYTAGNGLTMSNNKFALSLTSNGGLELTGTDGQQTVGVKVGNGLQSDSNGLSIKIDSSNANGLSTDASGLKIATATTSEAGAMSAADKVIVNKALTSDDIALMSDAEIGSWFGYAASSTMVTTTLPAVSDDSITPDA